MLSGYDDYDEVEGEYCRTASYDDTVLVGGNLIPLKIQKWTHTLDPELVLTSTLTTQSNGDKFRTIELHKFATFPGLGEVATLRCTYFVGPVFPVLGGTSLTSYPVGTYGYPGAEVTITAGECQTLTPTPHDIFFTLSVDE